MKEEGCKGLIEIWNMESLRCFADLKYERTEKHSTKSWERETLPRSNFTELVWFLSFHDLLSPTAVTGEVEG